VYSLLSFSPKEAGNAHIGQRGGSLCAGAPGQTDGHNWGTPNSRFQLDFECRKNENQLSLLCYEEIQIQKAVEKASSSGCPGLL
jgi:hypothetical protein